MSLVLDAIRPFVEASSRWSMSPRADWPERRRRLELLLRTQGSPRGTTVEETAIGGVPCERLVPRDGARDGARLLLYFHGGGYCVGSARTHRRLVATIAAAMGADAVVVDYRLAPEHPHPAPFEDARAVHAELAADGRPIVVAGDSCGAGLTLALAMTLRDEGAPAPVALGLICPWVDARPDVLNARAAAPLDAAMNRGLMHAYATAFLSAGASADDPLVSPLLGDLTGLPPIVMQSASEDVLASDARALAERLPSIEHRVLEGLWHDPHLISLVTPGMTRALRDLGERLAGL